MNTRTLHTHVSGPNSEKSSENLPSQLLYLEKMINAGLTLDEVQELRNVSHRPAILPLDKRYNDPRYDEEWREDHPHAIYGSCKAVHFYFSACTPDFPGFLVGVQQEFDSGVVYSGGIAQETMKKYLDFGYTKVNIQKKHGPNIKMLPTIRVESFRCEDYDFVSQMDVLSCEYGIIAVRLFTAAGHCSKMLFNRQFVNPALTDKDHHRDFSKLQGFKLESLPFIPRYFPSPQGKFGALAYFATFSRALNTYVSSTLNIHSQAEYAHIYEFIGGIRAYITHPIMKGEVTSNPVSLTASSPYADIKLLDANPNTEDVPHDDIIIAVTPATPVTTNMTPITPLSTVAPVPATYYNAADSSDCSCTCGEVQTNDWFPGFLLPSILNILTLGAIGAVGLVFGLPLVSRTKELIPPCNNSGAEATMITLSWYLACAFAGGLFLFTIVLVLLQCCGNEREDGPHLVNRWLYGLFLVAGIIMSSLGLKSVVSISKECLKTSEMIVSIILHSLMLLTPLTHLIGAIVNRKRARWWAEIFIIQWLAFIAFCIALAFLILFSGGSNSRRRRRR
jgi:hypothetical protein